MELIYKNNINSFIDLELNLLKEIFLLKDMENQIKKSYTHNIRFFNGKKKFALRQPLNYKALDSFYFIINFSRKEKINNPLNINYNLGMGLSSSYIENIFFNSVERNNMI